MMTFDRNDYRTMGTFDLLMRARDNGIDPELAIAITERLAAKEHYANLIGHFHFNQGATA